MFVGRGGGRSGRRRSRQTAWHFGASPPCSRSPGKWGPSDGPGVRTSSGRILPPPSMLPPVCPCYLSGGPRRHAFPLVASVASCAHEASPALKSTHSHESHRRGYVSAHSGTKTPRPSPRGRGPSPQSSLTASLALVAQESQGSPADHLDTMRLDKRDNNSRHLSSPPPPMPRRRVRRPILGCICFGFVECCVT